MHVHVFKHRLGEALLSSYVAVIQKKETHTAANISKEHSKTDPRFTQMKSQLIQKIDKSPRIKRCPQLFQALN